MHRDHHRVAEPGRADKQDCGKPEQEAEGDIESFGAGQGQCGQRHRIAGDQGCLTPLTGRDPRLVAEQKHHDDDADAAGIENVLAINAHEKFQGNADKARREPDPRIGRT